MTGKDQTIRELEAAIREAKKEVKRRVGKTFFLTSRAVEIRLERDVTTGAYEVQIFAYVNGRDGAIADGDGTGRWPDVALRKALNSMTDFLGVRLPKRS